MPHINNPMEIFKLLNGSNCRDCNEPSCLAFSVAVFKERKPINACPHLEKDVIDRYEGAVEKPNTVDEFKAQAIEALKQKVSEIDLCGAAERLGAGFSDNKLTLKIFGKKFSVDTKGNLSSEVPLLQPLQLVGRHSSILGFPIEEGSLANSMFTADIANF